MRGWFGCLFVIVVGCGPRHPTSHPESPLVEPWMQYASAGWLGCPPERVVISDARSLSSAYRLDPPTASTWLATCDDAVMVCSTVDDVRCAPLRAASAPEPTRTESPLVIRDLPPEVAECIERPVAVEVLFGGDGRLSELRPWPGETPEQRRCVERVLVEIDAPTGTGGPVLVRFEPRDPWQGTSGGD